VRELMTRDNLATVRAGRRARTKRAPAAPAPDREAAGGRRRLSLHRPDHRQGHRKGRHLSPTPTKDEAGRLRVAAATTVGDKGFERTEALIDAECDVIVIDTAHGHTAASRAVERVKKLSNSVQVIAGNVATAEATRALIDAGADASRSASGRARSAPRASSRASACRS
jgi:IMP dehydrogenase